MALKFSTRVRNARGNAIESTVGNAPTLFIRSGAAPANITDADSGTLLCTMALPSDWLEAAAAGVTAKKGTWTGTGSVAAGAGTPAGHFRIKDAGSPTSTDLQGTCTAGGGGGDMTLDNNSIANGQTVNVATFAVTEGNA